MREWTLALLLAAGVLWLLASQHAPPGTAPARLSAGALLSGDPAGFRRVTGPAPVVLPADHAAHPGYQHEWWYFTGNLDDGDGRRYGFQFTLFRFALRQEAVADSAWDADQVWMAHLALSDVASRTFLSRERFARGALDLAGATEGQWWLKDWQVTLGEDGWRLTAGTEDFALDLGLQPLKPPALQGEAGYSRKGRDPGNASRYFSFTRLAARGSLKDANGQRPVSGLAWLDREWGSSALDQDLAGWDWFALHLDDGRDLMYYRLRTHAGATAPTSAGILVDTDGMAIALAADAVSLGPSRRWRDPHGSAWPVAWRLALPEHDLDLEIEAVFDAQVWDASIRYWEGAVDVHAGGERVGRGYLEMTGYAD